MKQETAKLLITGSVGAGKTTAINAISEIPTVCTDTPVTMDKVAKGKTTTTVAMDYGEVRIDRVRRVGVFGTPGQRRYDFMCRILSQGALGVVILLDQTAEDPVDDLLYFVDIYQEMVAANAVVVGVTHTEGNTDLGRYYEALNELGLRLPVFTLDARDRSQVHLLLSTLLATVEATRSVARV